MKRDKRSGEPEPRFGAKVLGATEHLYTTLLLFPPSRSPGSGFSSTIVVLRFTSTSTSTAGILASLLSPAFYLSYLSPPKHTYPLPSGLPPDQHLSKSTPSTIFPNPLPPRATSSLNVPVSTTPRPVTASLFTSSFAPPHFLSCAFAPRHHSLWPSALFRSKHFPSPFPNNQNILSHHGYPRRHRGHSHPECSEPNLRPWSTFSYQFNCYYSLE
jgi:hypothetical protein